ncbi:MAG: C4-type zinc ribbon domain-containing protein [Endomicrobium sp.]|jgi:predicted  nucleic acid-binding Zn-ribbon protein|nr:C4-type zinc ribbon domain-containing protein [Endomicrobium sp.]
MGNLKHDLELLCELQKYDVKTYNLKEKINKIYFEIEEKKRILELENKKINLNVKKENFIRLKSLKNEKEALLDSKEKKINKYLMELNIVKSNDTYKALLFEIEKTRKHKSILEDEILELMEKVDKEYIIIKTGENELKKIEQKVKNELYEIKNFAKKLEEEINEIEKEKEKQKLKINKAMLLQYERLRNNGRNEKVVCIIDGESCSGCGILLRPQLINQVQKYHELVFCDNCSRILLKN